MSVSPAEIAQAWYSVTDRWVIRRNKMNHAREQWEVVHDWGGDLVSEGTRKIIGKFAAQEEAEELAREREDEARGAAVLAMLVQ